jgi:hypothetical protein
MRDSIKHLLTNKRWLCLYDGLDIFLIIHFELAELGSKIQFESGRGRDRKPAEHFRGGWERRPSGNNRGITGVMVHAY